MGADLPINHLPPCTPYSLQFSDRPNDEPVNT